MILLLLLLGCAVGAGATWAALRLRLGNFQRLTDDILHKGERDVETKLREMDLSLKQKELEQIQKQVDEEVASALQAAAAAPWPEKSSAYTDIQDTGKGRWLG